MIKRNGVEVMNERTKNVSIAKDTLEILKCGSYTSLNGVTIDISVSLDAAIKGTILYKDPLTAKVFESHSQVVEVTHETTAQAAVRLIAAGKTDIAALNFASAKNPGGGFLGGALAQEEDLCRCSGLYACTKSKPIFYNENILCDNCYYTDNIIYSPKVPFFRNQYNLFIEEPFLLSIISAPAPNLNAFKIVDKSKVAEVLVNRMDKILAIAANHNHKTLILGAWGCGAFGNDPSDVAELFKSALIVTPAFEHVCFAVYDSKPGLPIYTTFKEVLG